MSRQKGSKIDGVFFHKLCLASRAASIGLLYFSALLQFNEISFFEAHSRTRINLFGKCFSVLCVIVSIFTAMVASSAKADNTTAIVYYDCQPNKSLYVRAFFAYDIQPTVNSNTIRLNDLNDSQVKTCQITSTDVAKVKIGISIEHPMNDNVSIFVNENWLGTYTFSQTEKFNTYIISNLNGKIDITAIESSTKNKIRKSYLSEKGSDPESAKSNN